MKPRTELGPLVREVLIVDSELAEGASIVRGATVTLDRVA